MVKQELYEEGLPIKKLQDVLEYIKKQGNYAVTLVYGEDVGCDDIALKQEKRTIIIYMTPVGYIGEVRKMWKGSLDDLLEFDFRQKPIKVSNPPGDEIPADGYYAWGTESVINDYMDSFAK